MHGDREELLTFWLADQVMVVVAEEKKLSDKVLSIAKANIELNNFQTDTDICK
ncbi:hypothetical protein FACS189437_03310 [Bacteroidia bacterium]|nr:hypothetical protein FACS189437_03310 [Bacteroidia bacterium]